MNSPKRHSLFALLTLVAALAIGCEDDKGPNPAPTATVSVLTPVPAPDGLLGEIFMPAPEATWVKARGAVGGAMSLLPQTFGGLVTTLVGLPITSSTEVDGDIAVLGAIVDTPGQPQPRAAIGIHVKGGDRVLTQATKGDSPRFTARVDKATNITLLDPKGAKGPVALGILGNYLLVAQDEESLLTIGPYVARTMPSSTNLPKDDVTIDVPERALSGSIHTNLKTGWERVSGRERTSAIQPLVDVDAVMDSALAVIADLARARVSINLVGGAVRTRLAMTPKAGDGAASRMAREMAVGDAERLLDLPADTLVALMWRDRSEARGAAATARAGAIAGLVGKDIPEKDKEMLAAALAAAAEARGDWFVGGLSLGPTGPAGYGRGAVKDEEKLEKALKGLFAASKLPSVKSRLATAKLAVSSGKLVVEDVPGDVHRLKLSRIEDKPTRNKKVGPPPPGLSPGGEIPASIELLARLGKEQFLLAAGYDAREALKALIAAGERDNLRGVDSIKETVGSLGGEVAFALVVEPLRIVASRAGKPGAAESAPVMLAWGTEKESKETIWARLDLANVAVRELVKRRGAF